MIKQYYKILNGIWLLTFLLFQLNLSAQLPMISLSKAQEIANENYAGLERDRLVVDQQNKLSSAGLRNLPAQISISGEEFDFDNINGIHSLNLMQNFYLPKATNVQKQYYKQGAVLAESRLALTQHQLEYEVEKAYYKLLYAKQEKSLVDESYQLYKDFLEVATKQLKSGETGKIPQLAARSRLGQAKLHQEHAIEIYKIALTIFNQWLNADTKYDAEGFLFADTNYELGTVNVANPYLQVVQAQRELAKVKVETQKAQNMPQINTGLRLQTTFDDFPLFGYQLGVILPLFKKAANGHVEAAEIGVLVQEAAMESKKQEIERIVSEVSYKIEHQLHVLDYLEKDLGPVVNEQEEVFAKAYREGEITYLEYLDGLEQVVMVKEQYLEALYEYNILLVELNYWLGK